jgi:hypothetical protein
LRIVGLQSPVRVAFVVDDQRKDTVVVGEAASDIEGRLFSTISSVGQLVLPTSVVEALNLGVDRMVYVRAVENEKRLEMMSPRQALAPKRSNRLNGTGPR